MHVEFFNNFKQFKDSLEAIEENNFKYLRCRLDFNMYYQIKQIQDMGAESMDDEMEYGQEDDEEDIGLQDDDDASDDDDR
jgi:hypothetical protein